MQGEGAFFAMRLDWMLEGELQVDTLMARRSTSRSYPTYPPVGHEDLAFPLPYHGGVGTCLDEEYLHNGYVYRYRIAALYQHKAVFIPTPSPWR